MPGLSRCHESGCLALHPRTWRLSSSGKLARRHHWRGCGHSDVLYGSQDGCNPNYPVLVSPAVDFLVGVLFLLAPFALGFTGLDAWYYWANGAAVLLVISLQKPEAMQARMASA